MSKNTTLLQDLEEIQHGLFLMSAKDRQRALSTHETDDLVEALRELVAQAIEKSKA